MCLMYIARLTRTDLLLSSTYLASKSHSPTSTDMRKLGRVLRYLKGTIDQGVTIHCTELRVYAFCDASYAIHSDGRSHTGFLFSLGRCFSYLHARCSKQKLSATSSTDAEIFAVVDCLKVLVWICNLLQELAICKKQTSILYQDNQSAILLLQNPGKSKRSRHILSKISFAHDLISEGQVSIKYLETDKMLADLLTKPQPLNLFKEQSRLIMEGGVSTEY